MTEEKTAAFFDVDGTLTSQRVWGGIFEYFKRNRKRRFTHYAFGLIHYPQYILNRLGLMSQTRFRMNWSTHLAWYYRGYTPEEASLIWDWIVHEYMAPLFRGDTVEKLKSHLDNGDIVVLVSGGPEPLLRAIAAYLGVSHVVGTRPKLLKGRYSGDTYTPCLGPNKVEYVKSYLNEERIRVNFGNSFAYADGISDLHLLEMVGNAVATHPEDKLESVAVKRGWEIFPARSAKK